MTNSSDSAVLERLYKLILSRKGGDPEKSHTAKLFSRGRPRMAQKVGEEAVEVIIAAVQNDTDAIRAEAADVLFHFLVLMKSRNISLESILSVLAQRTSQSGHSEKAGRSK